jgi:Tfp pilus assembly protein PilO
VVLRPTTPDRNWINTFREPLRLRWSLAAFLAVLGLLAIHWPCSYYARVLTKEIRQEHIRHQLDSDISALRQELETFERRLPKQRDVNEWRQHIIERLLTTDLKLVSLEPGKKQVLGPYQLVVLRLELQGSYQELDRFLEWIEHADRLLRIDGLSVSPNRTSKDVLNFQLTLTGIMG